MTLLMVGGGGREHALAWRLRQSPRVREILLAPGNAGTALEPGMRNVAVAATDVEGLVRLAREERVDLTVIGPEAPLSLGVVDAFRAAGLRCFGPSRAAAQLEASKSFAKHFLARHAIPTAGYAVFTELAPALAHVRSRGAPIVIKADGLAAGKGVVVAQTLAEAEDALAAMLGAGTLGEAGRRVVVEEFMAGEEASYIVLAAGEQYLAMASSQDHKRRDDGDLGPNTGGMGAYSPAPVVSHEVDQRVRRTIIEPTLAGLAREGMPFTGFLYAGLMIDAAGQPRVVEFNVRFGDPETQPVMLRLQSDLLELIEAALDGRLGEVECRWDPRPAIAVVLAAQGYPGEVRKGDAITGLAVTQMDGVKVFHAATRMRDGVACTDGGRVLTVCALGEDLAAARRLAYQRVESLTWLGMFCRRDIGLRGLEPRG
ncbi:MAG: phosphoribosylamine--glycine ligase [Xanthomonadales bacterium PRO6]|nr:Phosphoribosylamine--glycine ligase [Xanthomonadales bacterium]MCE7931933.1 phosphoribosylamine--glycine ligase [Xanthomonadales bacterium PRO6]